MILIQIFYYFFINKKNDLKLLHNLIYKDNEENISVESKNSKKENHESIKSGIQNAKISYFFPKTNIIFDNTSAINKIINSHMIAIENTINSEEYIAKNKSKQNISKKSRKKKNLVPKSCMLKRRIK